MTFDITLAFIIGFCVGGTVGILALLYAVGEVSDDWSDLYDMANERAFLADTNFDRAMDCVKTWKDVSNDRKELYEKERCKYDDLFQSIRVIVDAAGAHGKIPVSVEVGGELGQPGAVPGGVRLQEDGEEERGGVAGQVLAKAAVEEDVRVSGRAGEPTPQDV